MTKNLEEIVTKYNQIMSWVWVELWASELFYNSIMWPVNCSFKSYKERLTWHDMNASHMLCQFDFMERQFWWMFLIFEGYWKKSIRTWSNRSLSGQEMFHETAECKCAPDFKTTSERTIWTKSCSIDSKKQNILQVL